MSVEAYRYHLPQEVGSRSFVEVVPAGPREPAFKNLAWNWEKLMREAWGYQFSPQLSALEISRLAEAHKQRIQKENISDGQPAYVLASIKIPTQTQKNPMAVVDYVAGVGKSMAAGRENQPRLAAISDIYVDPRYQSRGIGTSVYRSLLDGFHQDEQLVAYELEKAERAISLLHRLGYQERKRWQVERFGQKLDQIYYRGMLVGDMIELVEAKSPWVKDRESIS